MPPLFWVNAMTPEVDICNLALAHLGDNATIASLDPPEGSAQAEHAARFYPMARDAMLEMHPWAFAARRAVLALRDDPRPPWRFVYSAPHDALRILTVRRVSAAHDTDTDPFEMESSEDGDSIILTDTEEAMVRYVAYVTDASTFSPMFTIALSWHLASMLAGPMIKGAEGATEAKRCAAMSQAYLASARTMDANQRHHRIDHQPGWISAR